MTKVLVYGSIGCISVAVHYGLGRHTNNLTLAEAIMSVKILWIGFQVTPSAEAAAKISITLMLIRITTSRTWRGFFYSLIAVNIMITIMTLFSILLSCKPIQLLWDPSVSGSCANYERTVDIYIQGGRCPSRPYERGQLIYDASSIGCRLRHCPCFLASSLAMERPDQQAIQVFTLRASCFGLFVRTQDLQRI